MSNLSSRTARIMEICRKTQNDPLMEYVVEDFVVDNDSFLNPVETCSNIEFGNLTNIQDIDNILDIPNILNSTSEGDSDKVQHQEIQHTESIYYLTEDKNTNKNSALPNDVDNIDNDQDPIFTPDSNEDGSSESDQSDEDVLEKENENQSSIATVTKRWSVQLKDERKRKRNTGKAYTTSSGKFKRAKRLIPLRNCRMKCNEKICENDRKLIFDEYWAMASYDKRVAYCASLIGTAPKATERKKNDGNNTIKKNRNLTHNYSLELKGERLRVCKSCFRNTFDISEKFIATVVKKKCQSTGGSTDTDQRGKHPPPHKTPLYKLKEIQDHIQSFPAYQSHYSRRHSDKKYFASNLNLATIYRLYKEKVKDPVSMKIFSCEFYKTGIRFKKPKLDTCSKCDAFNMQLKMAKDDERREEISELLKNHQDMADAAYAKKKEDKERGKNDPLYRTFTFDLQQVLPTAYITADKVFYLRQLSTYNLTVHDGVCGNSTHFMWHEAVGGRGANDIASCLYRHIKNLPPEITDVVYYSDTCGGQNKNSFVSAMFQYSLVNHPTLKTIEHKFLVAGHTHMECDVDHAAIERRKKHFPFPIQLPRDWYNLVRTTGKKNKFNVLVMENQQFFSFSNVFKGPLQIRHCNSKKQKFNWQNIQWLKYEKGQFGIVQYKTSLNETEPFEEINYVRKGRRSNNVISPLLPLYEGALPISAKKKKNLLELMPYIDEDDRQFYINLLTDDDLKDSDPDLDRTFSDEDVE